jgi:hypothetical protein
MPCLHIDSEILTVAGDYLPGDPSPSGYLETQEWAEVQIKAGLRQSACCKCGLCKFPQELSDQYVRTQARTSKGEIVKLIDPVCLDCADKH